MLTAECNLCVRQRKDQLSTAVKCSIGSIACFTENICYLNCSSSEKFFPPPGLVIKWMKDIENKFQNMSPFVAVLNIFFCNGLAKKFQQRFFQVDVTSFYHCVILFAQKLLLSWDVNDVCKWLGELGLSQYSEMFRTNEIDGAELANIDNKILSDDLGIGKHILFC